MALADIIIKMPQDSGSVVSAVLSGIFLIVGSILTYKGTKRASQAQIKIAEMQIDERLIAENKLQWSNETRGLIAKFIRKCFEINHVMDSAEELKKLNSKKKSVNSADLKKLLEIRSDVISTQDSVKDLVELVTEIRLRIFDSEDPQGNGLLKKILDIEQYFSEFKKIPASELDQLAELSRQYFEQQFKELTTRKDDK